MTAIGVLAFVVAMLVSVMLHEAGHFFTARRFRMKATQFFVGFGPTLWSRHRGETEYGIKAVPAGGFVKIIGMTPLEEVEPGDEDRAFFRQKPWQKLVVLVAGSTVHFIITLVLIFGTLVTFGAPDDKALAAPQACVVHDVGTGILPTASAKPVDKVCPAGSFPAPAAAAGLHAGDRVLSVNGKAIKDYLGFRSVIRANPGNPLTLVVERDGARKRLTVTPAPTYRPDLDDPNKQVLVGSIGVAPDVDAYKRVGVLAAVPKTGDLLGQLVQGTIDTVTTKLSTITKVYSKDRDPGGFVGLVGVGRVSGEIASAPDISFKAKVAGFLLIMASLNLFVGVFNLLPLLPLDGGHIAVVWYEAVRDRIRRARGYVGEVVRVDYNKLMPVTLAVIVLFASFTVWLLGADIVNPIRINQ